MGKLVQLLMELSIWALNLDYIFFLYLVIVG